MDAYYPQFALLSVLCVPYVYCKDARDTKDAKESG
jgi:hypothetical protein